MSTECVNPDHCRSSTKVEWGQILARRGTVRGLPSKCAGSRKGWDKRGRRLSPQDVAEIRASEISNAALARKFGVSSFAVYAARNQITHKATMHGASVFTLGRG